MLRLNKNEIIDLLPHREPMLLIDELINIKKLFSATTKIEDAVPNSDLILLSLPTPMDESNIPDYSSLRNAASKLGSILTTLAL